MPAPIVAACPHCDKKLKIKKHELIGKKIRCPQCREPFRIEPQAAVEKKEDNPFSYEDDDWLDGVDELEKSGERIESDDLPPAPAPVARKVKNRKIESKVTSSSSQSRSQYRSYEGLGIIGWVIGGCVAGFIGALIWGGIAYATGFEVGWIAWAIGGMVGFGVLMGAGENADTASGIVAVFIAIGSVFAGKIFAIWMFFMALMPAVNNIEEFKASDSYMISEYADVIVEEQEAAGVEIQWPEFDDDENTDFDNYDYSKDYPADIWKKAEEQWVALSVEEQAAKIKEVEEFEGAFNATALFGWASIVAVFTTLGPFDALWILLAGATAYRIGSNSFEGD
ncbi:hypothetical protein [uncultured Rubinisphaera sp.]|uniref:hypothetical protein n=1 Tax=uncultured Rubinisphaera sp. TaxID=1678686 RepID=UPI0030DB6F13|tara:strand:- start:76 stop:1089 length:1014 start_codon:yes stop_codon:yes gene_type:complete